MNLGKGFVVNSSIVVQKILQPTYLFFQLRIQNNIYWY